MSESQSAEKEWLPGSAGPVLTDREKARLAKADRVNFDTLCDAVRGILAERLAPVEALIGGREPLIILSDRPNKIVRVSHRDDRLGATVTQSMVKVDDLRDALYQPAEPREGSWTSPPCSCVEQVIRPGESS